MSSLAFTWFPQAKNIFEARVPEGLASLPFLAGACLGVSPFTSIHVPQKPSFVVILLFLSMLSQAEARQMGKAAASSVGMFPGSWLLRGDASASRLTWLLYFGSGKDPNPPVLLILTYPFKAQFQSLLTSFFPACNGLPPRNSSAITYRTLPSSCFELPPPSSCVYSSSLWTEAMLFVEHHVLWLRSTKFRGSQRYINRQLETLKKNLCVHQEGKG